MFRWCTKKKPIKNRLRENIAHTFQKAACIWPSFVVMTAKWYQTLSDLEWGARYLLPETWLGFCSDKINNCVSRSATFIQKLGLWVVLIQLRAYVKKSRTKTLLRGKTKNGCLALLHTKIGADRKLLLSFSPFKVEIL